VVSPVRLATLHTGYVMIHNSSAVLFKSFLQAHCPTIKRIGGGHMALMQSLWQTYRGHISIDLDQEVFMPAKEMQALTRDYAIIRDSVCIMKGYHNKEAGLCDLIIGWTAAFSDAMLPILKEEFALRLSKNSTDAEDLSLYVVIKDYGNRYQHNITAFPGADAMNYTKSDKTHRLHHPDQNIPKDMKRLLFKGCTDYDIQACFPNIYKKNVLGGKEFGPIDLMINRPDEFLNMIIEDDAFTHLLRIDTVKSPRQKAKIMRSRLFHPPATGKLPRTGCEWYDELGDVIAGLLKQSGIDKPHLYFTMIEQEIIERAFDAFGRDDILLRMHDGFIAYGTAEVFDKLHALEQATGYKWTAQLYE